MSRSALILAGFCLSTPLAVAALLSLSGCGTGDIKAPPTASSEPGAKDSGAEKGPRLASKEDEPSPKSAPMKDPDVKPAAAVSNGHGGHGAPVPPKPMLSGWETPAVALVLSGEQHGYLEPCGCSELQSGGLSRRADLFRQLIKGKKWETVALDLGGIPKRERAQSRIKYDVIRKGLMSMGYALQGIGPEELRIGVDTLISFVPNANEADAPLPFVAANVVLFDTPDFGTPAHQRIIKAGDLTIGVTAILDPAIARTLLPEGAKADWSVTAAEPALKEALKELKGAKPDLLVLLSHSELETSKKLAEQFPEFDLILSAGGAEDPDEKPVRTQKPMIVTVGHKGKYAGVVGVYPENKKQPLRFELVNIDKFRFRETPSMSALMRDYQERLKDEQVAGKEQPIPHPTGHAFVGAEKCGECHTKAFAKWSTTGHAKAFNSIITGGHVHEKEGTEPFVSRIFDAECIACHTVGWNPQEVLRYDSGYLPPEFVEGDARKHMEKLRGNQCENCHGPGSHHVAWAEGEKMSEADAAAAKKEMKVTLAFAKDTLCYRCHDQDNSPKFKAATFDSYWEQIKHPGKD